MEGMPRGAEPRVGGCRLPSRDVGFAVVLMYLYWFLGLKLPEVKRGVVPNGIWLAASHVLSQDPFGIFRRKHNR